ncbi:MAG TPA: energy transducer TonB [Terriglobales bacterium]|jgi:TonB family protein|nr:energy transducer TonB [Terriglobales bacterium]
MLRHFAWLLPLLLLSSLSAQTAQAPQTARQALIEMFFGTAPNHLEKHLSDSTRNTFKRMSGEGGMSMLDEFSMFTNMTKAGGVKFETFDTGPTLLQAEEVEQNEKTEISVESDNLSGDEDEIELTLHITKEGNEQPLPFIPHFTFIMKTEADVWRLNEIRAEVRVPLADPEFLKNIERQNGKQNEQGAQLGMRVIIAAQTSYHSSHGTYACSLSSLMAKGQSNGSFADLATGKHGGYVYAISGCDGTQYKVVAEPEISDSGQRAFCSDESGAMRAASDGKATTCLSSGEAVSEQSFAGQRATAGAGATGPQIDVQSIANAKPQNTGAAPQGTRPMRVRVSQGVMQGMVISKVQPVYPADAKAARIQGSVVIAAIIGKDGNIQSERLMSGHPLLAPAAMDAVRQWKYRPYLLNGQAMEVDTQVTVNFTLSPN